MALLLSTPYGEYWRVSAPAPDYITRRAKLTFVVYASKAARDAGAPHNPAAVKIVRLDFAAFDTVFDPVKAGTKPLFDACYEAALADRQFDGGTPI